MKIAIIGAGIAGRLMALRARAENWEVDLFDLHPAGEQSNCSYAAAGLLTPYAELMQTETIVLELAITSLTLWPGFLKQLAQPVFWQKQGSLIVAHAKDHAELISLQQQLAQRLPQSLLHIEMLNAARLGELEPELPSSFNCGLFFPEEAQLCPRELLNAFTTTLLQREVRWHHETTVENIQPHTITIAKQTRKFDWVIDCRGLQAKTDLPTLRGVRGEIILLHAPEVKLQRPIRLLHPRYPLYIAPRPHQQFVIGATTIESEDASPISVQSTLELLSAAYSLHRGFAEARILSTRTHCRPAFPNNIPQLFTEAGLIRINGLYRHGYLVAPALVEQALHFIKKEHHL